MESPELLNTVLDFLLAEQPVASPPSSYAERRRLMRALVNVRPALPVPAPVLAAQDALLALERDARGVVDPLALPAIRDEFPQCDLPHADRLCLWRGDITRLAAGAIVNAANARMEGCMQPLHDCIDNAIHCAAGMQLRQECHDAMLAGHPSGHWAEPTGSARATNAYNLPCCRVFHTVGPIVDGPLTARHKDLLASSYRSCLALAHAEGLDSLAFCSISTGVFRFPKPEAARIAVDETVGFLTRHPGAPLRVIFNVFGEADHAVYRELFASFVRS